MRSNRKHSPAELANYIHLYKEGISYDELCDQYGLSITSSVFRRYYLKYLEHGFAGLESQIKNNSYSEQFKQKVVQEYLKKEISSLKLARKYNIPSDSTVRNWIIKYTKGEELKDYHPKPEVYTMKGQKKTYLEKIDVVKDFLELGMSYKETAEKHKVSYNNVYSWVQKYKKYGPNGLIDSRGRRKPSIIQTEEEKLRTELAALKARNEYLETENAALKKLKEVERELMSGGQNTKRNLKQSKN
ncbi:transposase [Aerococcus sp. UMB8608]|uniref:Transposase n=2 Tax=Aerococcus TaxID=1375 RepID=A0A5N1GPP6_9LACT|nr:MULTISPECIES: helix-turn-helix domain-containing protein [Aerococcus]KAA9302229.1 transposase [Aerococcus sanguinicola]MDK6370218.1 transposase [Aerococcus sp. UMB9870]MDK6680784.1 transposase [Aerococcus sp. UMB8608]MDK6687645.1 transposase [Aerococcus sp. UMB8623]MDK6941264.1 transposase [Aerococcus sp. UMB8487]